MSPGARILPVILELLAGPGVVRGRTARPAIVALLGTQRGTSVRSVICWTVGLELQVADAEREEGSGLSVARLGGVVGSGSVSAVAVSPLARVRIARTVPCAIWAAVAMSRWASPSRVPRAIVSRSSCSASRRRRAARSTRPSSSRESAVRAVCCPCWSAWATVAMGCPEAIAAVAASARAWASGAASSGFSPPDGAPGGGARGLPAAGRQPGRAQRSARGADAMKEGGA